MQKTWVCDGIHDCSRGEDESKCEPKCEENQFRCGNVSSYNSTSVISSSTITCIGKKHVCDGKRDCPKGEGKAPNYHTRVTASQRLRICCLFHSQHSCCPLSFNVGGHAISFIVFQAILWKPFILCLDYMILRITNSIKLSVSVLRSSFLNTVLFRILNNGLCPENQ
jgi:hypothetical protein